MKDLKLADEVIGHIAQLVQLSILTQSEVVDKMRNIGLKLKDDNTLVLTESYAKSANKEIDDLMEHMEVLKKEMREAETQPKQ